VSLCQDTWYVEIRVSNNWWDFVLPEGVHMWEWFGSFCYLTPIYFFASASKQNILFYGHLKYRHIEDVTVWFILMPFIKTLSGFCRLRYVFTSMCSVVKDAAPGGFSINQMRIGNSSTHTSDQHVISLDIKSDFFITGNLIKSTEDITVFVRMHAELCYYMAQYSALTL